MTTGCGCTTMLVSVAPFVVLTRQQWANPPRIRAHLWSRSSRVAKQRAVEVSWKWAVVLRKGKASIMFNQRYFEVLWRGCAVAQLCCRVRVTTTPERGSNRACGGEQRWCNVILLLFFRIKRRKCLIITSIIAIYWIFLRIFARSSVKWGVMQAETVGTVEVARARRADDNK